METKNVMQSVGAVKSIETPELIVKGNIMTWGNTMIQLSNVSSVFTVQETPKFPSSSLVEIVVGFIFCFIFSRVSFMITLGILLIFLGAITLAFYFIAVSNNKFRLCIIMNSGSRYDLVVGNKNFLSQMLIVLEQIIIDGGVGNRSITIDIKNSNIGSFKAFDHAEIG